MSDNKGERKPISVVFNPNGDRILVVCDDGSVWSRSPNGTDWKENLPIPGTRRAHEVAKS